MPRSLKTLYNKDIILIGTEKWGECFVSKHHYAANLAKYNNVWYINPVCYQWKIENLVEIPIDIEETEFKNLYQVSYANPIPRLNKWNYSVQRFIFKRIIALIKQEAGIDDENLLIWNFDLGRFVNLADWNAKHTIAHVVEIIDNDIFSTHYRYIKNMIASADTELAVADLIKEQIQNLLPSRKVHFINHGADIKNFKLAKSKMRVKLPGKNSIKAGFIGNFQMSFDFELLERLAERNPNVDFIMVGPKVTSNLSELCDVTQNTIERLNLLQNIYFTGIVASSEIMRYQLGFDINIILFKDKYKKNHCNPHKMMAYFYSGNITVAKYIDQYKNHPELLLNSINNCDFIEKFQDVLANITKFNSEDNSRVRQKFAEKNSYFSQICKIDEIIS